MGEDNSDPRCQINFRLPPELRAELKKAAEEDFRSVSSLTKRVMMDYLLRRTKRGQIDGQAVRP